MTNPLSPQSLQDRLACGLLGFPLTDFDEDGALDPGGFADRVRFLAGEGCSALFVAGGAGEFFSLARGEYETVLRTAVEARSGDVPILGTAGGATCDAADLARFAERAGADGILLLPPYLTGASQAGLIAHVGAVCRATGLGVVVYSRGNGRLRPDSVRRLADECPNLVAFKDGIGDVEDLWAMRTALDGRLAFLNGMPTAEVYAPAFRAMGVPTYSSAVYNFDPKAALAFFEAVQRGDAALIDRMLQDFFIPYGRIRARQPGYAVSIVKAAATIAGRSAGRVRPPLSDLTTAEYGELEPLIAALAGFGETRCAA